MQLAISQEERSYRVEDPRTLLYVWGVTRFLDLTLSKRRMLFYFLLLCCRLKTVVVNLLWLFLLLYFRYGNFIFLKKDYLITTTYLIVYALVSQSPPRMNWSLYRSHSSSLSSPPQECELSSPFCRSETPQTSVLAVIFQLSQILSLGSTSRLVVLAAPFHPLRSLRIFCLLRSFVAWA